jgi:hypothetical protein
MTLLEVSHLRWINPTSLLVMLTTIGGGRTNALLPHAENRTIRIAIIRNHRSAVRRLVFRKKVVVLTMLQIFGTVEYQRPTSSRWHTGATHGDAVHLFREFGRDAGYCASRADEGRDVLWKHGGKQFFAKKIAIQFPVMQHRGRMG